MKHLEIAICRREEANDILAGGHFDALVSIGPHLELQYTPAHVLRLMFNHKTPWERVALNNVAKALHILELCDFAAKLPEGAKVLLHCGAGDCRAPAAAMVLLASAGWPSRKAAKEVHRVKEGRGKPNGWLLKLADVLLDTQLYNEAVAHYRVKWEFAPESIGA